jgi:hypothetical protein
MEFELVYCVLYDYYDDLDVVGVFSDKAEADSLAAKSSSYCVIESKIRKNNDANN